MTSWRGELSIGVGVATYVGPGGAADRHRHHAIQIAASIEDSVTVSLDDDSVLRARSVLIRSGVHHSFSATGPLALVLVEPNSEWGARLNTCIADGLQAVALDNETPLPSKLADPLVDLTSWIETFGPSDPCRHGLIHKTSHTWETRFGDMCVQFCRAFLGCRRSARCWAIRQTISDAWSNETWACLFARLFFGSVYSKGSRQQVKPAPSPTPQ